MTPPASRKKPGTPSIIEAMDDAQLFAPWFAGPSWAAWRVFLKALFCLPMDLGEIETFKLCTGREAPPSQPCAGATLIIGRRGGKSRILSLLACYLAALNQWHRFLAPGETGVVAIICPDRKQAGVVLRYVKGMLDGVPMLKRLVVRETINEIELSTGASIEVMTSDYRLVRGRTLLAGIVDEAAFLQTDEGSSTPDIEIVIKLALRTPRPTLERLSAPVGSRYPGRIVLESWHPANEPEHR